MCARITEKLIRRDLLWSLVQAPTWSRAWSLLRVLSSWVLKVSQDGNWTSFPGPISHSAQGMIFSSVGIPLLQAGSAACHPVTVLSCLCLWCLPFPSSKEFNKTNLLGCLLVCFPLSASLVSVFCEQNLVWVFGIFQRKILFLFGTLEKSTLEMYEQKKKLGGASREVPVLNSCLPNSNASYFPA